jgi:hypothetical protein
MAEATPCWAGGSDSTIDSVAGVMAKEIPKPITISAAISMARPLLTPINAMTATPTAATANPAAPTGPLPTRLARRGPATAAGMTASVRGSIVPAVFSDP